MCRLCSGNHCRLWQGEIKVQLDSVQLKLELGNRSKEVHALGRCRRNLVSTISWVKLSLHTENYYPRLPGSILDVYAVG